MSISQSEIRDYQYEYYDQVHTVIAPKSLKELKQALMAKAEIQEMIDAHMPDDADKYMEIMAVQESLIRTYVNSIGSFDNSILINNIAFLIKKYDIRLGDLENLLGISAGYISRTAKENSGKRMSIDIAWKISRLFNIDFGRLVTIELAEDKGNTAVLLKFINKMIKQTEEGKLQWEFIGGEETELDQSVIECGLITEEGETLVYHPDHLNSNVRFLLHGDIMCTRTFDDDGNDMMIIPFCREGDKSIHFDFIFTWDGNFNRGEDTLQWQKAFYTIDDPFGRLDKAASRLYEVVRAYELDAKLDPETRSFIDSYLEDEE